MGYIYPWIIVTKLILRDSNVFFVYLIDQFLFWKMVTQSEKGWPNIVTPPIVSTKGQFFNKCLFGHLPRNVGTTVITCCFISFLVHVRANGAPFNPQLVPIVMAVYKFEHIWIAFLKLWWQNEFVKLCKPTIFGSHQFLELPSSSGETNNRQQ